MKKILIILLGYLLLFIIPGINIFPVYSQQIKNQEEIDTQVKKFLESNKYSWHDMNIPASDGQILYDLIIRNGYTKALEIGTSTGHSGIWIAWALSKTGGKLITIDIDEGRHKEALENFKEAGLLEYIDARLGDAHRLVPALEGPFDFVFSDADKYWYTNYIKAVLPKLEKGGCFTAHNVSDLRRSSGMGEFIDFIENEPSLETTYDRTSRAGISISYKVK
jgi:predicted O-methyltransferase YrrM